MQGVGARMIRLPADPLIFQPFNCEIIPFVFILLLPGDGRGVGLLVRVEWGGSTQSSIWAIPVGRQ